MPVNASKRQRPVMRPTPAAYSHIAAGHPDDGAGRIAFREEAGAAGDLARLSRSNQEPLSCAHHYGQHTSALAKVAVGIQDESG